MAKELFYRQCRLEKRAGQMLREQVSYIPEPFCTVGKTLRLKDEDGAWEDGWVVVSAGERQPTDFVEQQARDYRRIGKVPEL